MEFRVFFVRVADDGDGGIGDLLQNRVGFRVVETAGKNDDQVGFVVKLRGGIFSHRFDDGEGRAAGRLYRGREISDEVAQQDSDEWRPRMPPTV